MHLYHAVVLNAKLFPSEKLFYLFATNALEHSGVVIKGIDVERHVHTYVEEIIARGEQTGDIRSDIQIEQTGHLLAVIFGALVGKEFGNKSGPARPSGEYLISLLFDGIKA